MKLLQILQKCLEDWKNISHLDFCLVNLDNTIYISTCDRALPSEEKLEEFKEDEVLCISNMNCRLYKVTESHQLQYVLIVSGNWQSARLRACLPLTWKRATKTYLCRIFSLAPILR